MSSEVNKQSNPNDKQKRRRRFNDNGFEEWGGYMAAKKAKLSAQFDTNQHMESKDQDVDETEIFKGVSVYVNGYTKPSADEIKRMMMIHGGRYHYYYSTRRTTHIVASNLPDSKIRKLKNEIVVKPEWIVDSIKAGKLLPHQNYLLYTPEFIHGQQKLKFQKPTLKNPLSCQNQPSSSTVPNPAASYSASDCSNLSESELENDEIIGSSPIAPIQGSSSSSRVCENSTALSPSKAETHLTAGQPGFLSEFYSRSRLHHISTAKLELKRYVQSLAERHDSNTFPGREKIEELVRKGTLPVVENDNSAVVSKLGSKGNQVVMHLDMDCFFVSVGLRKHPELRGQPVAVTHSRGIRGGAQEGSNLQLEAALYQNQSKKKVEGLTSVSPDSSDKEDESDELTDRDQNKASKISKYSKEYGSLSEVASCSYEARDAGVRNGMFLGEALRRCPNLKTIPYDFEGYSEVSKKLYDIVASYTLDIEAVSCDELYIDCKAILEETGVSPLQFASMLRSEIYRETACTASAGLGPNMLLARLANKAAKPNGQYFVSSEMINGFMAKQKVRDLPGVGYATSKKLEHQGVVCCSDLQAWSLLKMQQELGGKTGTTLYNRCRGKDDRVVELQKERKSVSAEVNYGIRFEKEEDIYKFLKDLSVEVVNRVQNINCKGKSITLKLMVRHPDAPVQTAKFMGHGVCINISKSLHLKSATDDPVVIGRECCTLAKGLKIKPEDYRGVGIQLTKLVSTVKENPGSKEIKNFFSILNNSAGEGDSKKELSSSSAARPTSDNPFKDENAAGKFESPVDSRVAGQTELSEVGLNEDSVCLGREQSSKLDQSVLNSLPDDIQQEVLNSYKQKATVSPPKSISNSVSSIVSSKLQKGSSKKNVASGKAKTNKSSSKQNTLLECFQSSKQSSRTEDAAKKPSTLAGASDINEVKSLVEEWVTTSQEILEEDVDEFQNYVLALVDENLKNVNDVMKYFYGVVAKADVSWQSTYLTVLSYVQQKVLQKFEMMLDAECTFPT